MSLKNNYASEAEIPAEVKKHYLERDGAWYLDSEHLVKYDEMRQSNINLLKEVASWKQRFNGIDPEVYRTLVEEKRQLEEKAALKAGEFEKVLSARLAAQETAHKKALELVMANAAKTDEQLSKVLIDQAVVAEATKHGLRPTALPDIAARARATIRLVDGQPQIFDGDVVKPGKDGVSPMTLAEWVEALGTDAPHLFEANAGGGAVGSSAGGTAAAQDNPWRKGAENLTKQAILLKTNPPLAKRLMALANK